jgi:probable addiction module antidote protein
MSKEILPWDAADYLATDADIADYLAAAFETGEVDDVTHALGAILRARGMTQAAREVGMSRGSLYKAVGDGANPTLATLFALLNSLNVTLSIKPKVPAAG